MKVFIKKSLVWTYKGFKLRGILDLITIDHDNKLVYFTDLKQVKVRIRVSRLFYKMEILFFKELFTAALTLFVKN
jgi:hypothetical protein